MSKETLEKIEKLEKAINSPITPEVVKETMRKVLVNLKSQKVEVEEVVSTNEEKSITKYNDIKSCLLDDGDDNDDYIYEGKHIHNVETLPKDTWEIVEFYNNGVVLKHLPISVLSDNKPNKNVSFNELKTLFLAGKIEVDGIENGNTKVFNLCVKAIMKCISNIDEITNKQDIISELTVVKNDLERNIEINIGKANSLENEKSELLTEKAELLNKNSDLERTSIDKLSSFEKAKGISDLETEILKKKLEDLEALNVVRSVIDMLNEDVMRKDLKELRTSEKEPKVQQIFLKQKIKVNEIKIHNAEGKVEGYGLPKTVNSYEEANDAITPIYLDAIEFEGNSNKSRFTVTFEDGETYNGDLLVGEKYDNPTKGNVIGKHIKNYLESEIKENRQSEESKKEITEFLEKYDLGFDDAMISANDDVMRKDLKELRTSEKEPKVEQIFIKQEGFKYKSGDFVFANRDSRNPLSKTPFVVSDFSNGKYYILGDGSHFVSENKLSMATEKDFDEYYTKEGLSKQAIDSYKNIKIKESNSDYDGINEFIDYVDSFYGKSGIYASEFKNNGFTKAELKLAINTYISEIDLKDDDNLTWGGGDTIDRERVRVYLNEFEK